MRSLRYQAGLEAIKNGSCAHRGHPRGRPTGRFVNCVSTDAVRARSREESGHLGRAAEPQAVDLQIAGLTQPVPADPLLRRSVSATLSVAA